MYFLCRVAVAVAGWLAVRFRKHLLLAWQTSSEPTWTLKLPSIPSKESVDGGAGKSSAKLDKAKKVCILLYKCQIVAISCWLVFLHHPTAGLYPAPLSCVQRLFCFGLSGFPSRSRSRLEYYKGGMVPFAHADGCFCEPPVYTQQLHLAASNSFVLSEAIQLVLYSRTWM